MGSPGTTSIDHEWLNQAAVLLRQRAPLIGEERIAEIVADLHMTWPDDTPATAMAKFFRDIPDGWYTEQGSPTGALRNSAS